MFESSILKINSRRSDIEEEYLGVVLELLEGTWLDYYHLDVIYIARVHAAT